MNPIEYKRKRRLLLAASLAVAIMMNNCLVAAQARNHEENTIRLGYHRGQAQNIAGQTSDKEPIQIVQSESKKQSGEEQRQEYLAEWLIALLMLYMAYRYGKTKKKE